MLTAKNGSISVKLLTVKLDIVHWILRICHLYTYPFLAKVAQALSIVPLSAVSCGLAVMVVSVLTEPRFPNTKGIS